MERAFKVIISFAACLFLLMLMTLSVMSEEASVPHTGGTSGDESRREGSIRIMGDCGIGVALSGCYLLREDGGADVFLSKCCTPLRSFFSVCGRMRLCVNVPGGINSKIPVRAIYAQHAPMFDLGRKDIPAMVVWEES